MEYLNIQNPKVTVCIVTFNRVKDVFDCIDSVYSSKFKDFNVLLFDNHSDEKIIPESLLKYPRLRYIYNNENLGVSGGRSSCEEMVTGEYIMFLDDDTIIDEDTIGELATALDADPLAGIVAPKMFFYDKVKTDIFVGGLGQFSKITTICSDITYLQKDIGQFENPVFIDYAQNGFMARSRLSKTIGSYNRKIFMTYQETDYFLRVQKLGYKTLYIPTAKLWHKVSLPSQDLNPLRSILGLPSPRRIYYNMRNRSFIVKEYFVWYAKIIYILFFVHLFFLYYFYKFIIYNAPLAYFKNLAKGYMEGVLLFLGIRRL